MEVINWFKSRHASRNLHFIQFDIVDFYPSISKALVERALQFLGSTITITVEEKKIILGAAQNILYIKGEPWIKSTTGLHDITMGGYSGAEICEFVGLYLLNQLKSKGLKPRLYRDDGLLLANKSKHEN